MEWQRATTLAEFNGAGAPPRISRSRCCEDHSGTYQLPFACRFVEAMAHNESGGPVEATVVGWRLRRPDQTGRFSGSISDSMLGRCARMRRKPAGFKIRTRPDEARPNQRPGSVLPCSRLDISPTRIAVPHAARRGDRAADVDKVNGSGASAR